MRLWSLFLHILGLLLCFIPPHSRCSWTCDYWDCSLFLHILGATWTCDYWDCSLFLHILGATELVITDIVIFIPPHSRCSWTCDYWYCSLFLHILGALLLWLGGVVLYSSTFIPPHSRCNLWLLIVLYSSNSRCSWTCDYWYCFIPPHSRSTFYFVFIPPHSRCNWTCDYWTCDYWYCSLFLHILGATELVITDIVLYSSTF